MAEDPSCYDEHAPEPVNEEALAAFGRKHLSHGFLDHWHMPAIPIPGLSTLEKKLVFFLCDLTGAPNPFHALERMTGDCVELQRVEKIWEAGYQDLNAKIVALRAGADALTPEWDGPEADRFEPALAVYLDELDALAGCIRTTAECVRAVRSEAQLAEGTIQMLINILIGSLGGMLVAEFITAGTVTPVAAAQAQVELAYVAKKIAFLGGKLNMVQSDITKILDAVRGFKRLEAMRFIFDLAAIE
ncbi:MAG TPA: hypothetical protein VG296_28190 [Actinospica sp.]|nr:hypothetical protein [Actinospica sp.]